MSDPNLPEGVTQKDIDEAGGGGWPPGLVPINQEYGKPTESLLDKITSLESRLALAVEALEWQCKFYCDWYNGVSKNNESPSTVCYELISEARQALAKIEGSKTEGK